MKMINNLRFKLNSNYGLLKNIKYAVEKQGEIDVAVNSLKELETFNVYQSIVDGYMTEQAVKRVKIITDYEKIARRVLDTRFGENVSEAVRKEAERFVARIDFNKIFFNICYYNKLNGKLEQNRVEAMYIETAEEAIAKHKEALG